MNSIKELRDKTGLSQSKFAERYGLSVRTLQQWEQGISKPLDSLLNLIENSISCDSNLRFLNNADNYKWKVCIDSAFLNCEKVYPIQQRKVKELINEIVKNNKNIKSISIFGSSVTDRCHIGSDVDIYVESKDDIKINKTFDFEYDLWSNKTADERLKKEIMKKGVIVYGEN